MHVSSNRSKWGIIGVLLLLVLGVVWWYTVPKFLPNPQRKPEPAKYEYYQILDEANGETLMYVSTIAVREGDELLTEGGKWYVVVRVVQNIAYARQYEKNNPNDIPDRKDNPESSNEGGEL